MGLYGQSVRIEMDQWGRSRYANCRPKHAALKAFLIHKCGRLMVGSSVGLCVTKSLAVPTNVWLRTSANVGHLASVPSKPEMLAPAEPETLQRHTLLTAGACSRNVRSCAVLRLLSVCLDEYITPASAVDAAPAHVDEYIDQVLRCSCASR